MSISNGFRRISMLIVHGATILIAARAHAERGLDVLDAAHGSCLVLEWMDPHELLPAGERWMAKETTRILAEADIPARWDWSGNGSDDDAGLAKAHEHRLRVVLLPSEPSGPGWGLESNTLGTTVIDGLSAPPAVYIFYRSIISLLSRRGRSADLSESDFLGPASRALGRVVAHEIAHAIARG